MTDSIGTIRWSIYDTATSRVVADRVGEKTLQASDVKIKRIKETLHNKKIELEDHFSFSLVDDVDRDKNEGFGLTGRRDDIDTFAWEWFEVDRAGHATKLQESGELSFDTKKTPNGIEIARATPDEICCR
jgi:hypothetical protein